MKKQNFRFLFSALALIYEYILTNDTDNSLEVINKLTELSRYCLSEKDDVVKAEKELERIEMFLFLQQLRFQNDFHYSIEAEETLKYQLIKRFVFLEPVMEFFYNHIEATPHNKLVHIKFEIEDAAIWMLIKDDSNEIKTIYRFDY